MTIYREVWVTDFGMYINKLRARLVRRGCILQDLDLREAVEDQEALAA